MNADPSGEDAPQRPIGIDLGTTYSVLAYLDANGRPTTILNDSGDLLTPSAVAFENGQVIVGKEAVKSSVFEPNMFADCFKRDIGRRRFRRKVSTHDVPPEVLSGFVLERLKLDAERRLGPIRKVVITVPAFFDEARRSATQDAGRLAGLEVLDIINEPTAAAISFGYFRKSLQLQASTPVETPERILVYDLGGGTFDVTVLEIRGEVYRTLATDGDVQLGGTDFDERLVNYAAEQFMIAHGSDPREDAHDAAQLWFDVQIAKHSLSERGKATVVCSHSGKRMRIEVTQAGFEQLTSDLLERTETTTMLVLRQAKLDWAAIDRVLLVGGSTRMPMITNMLRRLSGKEPDRSISPDESVAHGATLYAGLLMAKPGSTEAHAFELINVNSHSLGIIGIDRRANRARNIVLIPKNTPLPCSAVRKFATARDNQSNVKVAIVEGESENPEHCIRLGECVVRNLPPALKKGTRIDVEYKYAANGRISVRARVPAARQSASVEIQYDGHMHIASLDTWRQKLCGLSQISILENESGATGCDPIDPAAISQRINDLFEQFGEYAISLELPPVLNKYKSLALSAGGILKDSTSLLIAAEKTRQAAIGQTEVLRCDADVARQSAEVQLAEARSHVARLDLGRECVAAEYAPAKLERLYAEIRRLQDLSGQG